LATCFYISSTVSMTSKSATNTSHSASTSTITNVDQEPPSLKTYHENEIGKGQRIVILAGPHKTGTSSLQYNFVRWTKQRTKGEPNATNTEMSTSTTAIWDDWVWPIPDAVAKIYSPTITNSSSSSSSPSEVDKAYYPLMEALRSPERKIPDREIFHLYTPDKIIQLFSDSIAESWELGYNLVFGSEAMDLLVKLPEGQEMLKKFSDRILPIKVAPQEGREKGRRKKTTSDTNGSEITVVVTYRTPKIDHLISNWHQVCKGKDTQPFFKYITTTSNKLGVLNGLGLVEIFLKNTNWNVALVDYEFVKESEWDLTSYIACHFLKVECDLETKQIVGLVGEENPTIKNVRKSQRPPNLSDEALAEMDSIMMAHDCNYKYLFEAEKEWKDRLISLHKLGIDKMMDNCKTYGHDYPNLDEMKEKLVQVAKKHGPKKLGS